MSNKISDSNESENISVFLRVRPKAKSEMYQENVISLDPEVLLIKYN